MLIGDILLDSLFAQAEGCERKRMNYDLRTGVNDGGQRMLNALLPGTVVPIHRHPMSNENVLLLKGRLDEVIYNDLGVEIDRIALCPADGRYGCVVPKGAWHTVEVMEPSVIYEAKDGRFGEDGSEVLDVQRVLKRRIEELIEMEQRSGSMERALITPEYVYRMLGGGVELSDIEEVMRPGISDLGI